MELDVVLVIVGVCAGLGLDLLALSRPRLLAALARVPLGTPVRVPLGAGARELLTLSGGSYREQARGRLALDVLQPGEPIVVSRAVVTLEARRAIVRLPWNAALLAFSGVVVVHAHEEEGALVMRAQLYPTFLLTITTFFAPMIMLQAHRVALAVILLAIWLCASAAIVLRTHRWARPLAQRVMFELEDRVRARDA